jgi:hypothetical protein
LHYDFLEKTRTSGTGSGKEQVGNILMHRKSGARLPFDFNLAATERHAELSCAFHSETPARSLLARWGVAPREGELALNSQLSTFLITQI